MSCMTYWKGSYPCAWNICWATSCRPLPPPLMSSIGALTLLTSDQLRDLIDQKVASVPPIWMLQNLGNQVRNTMSCMHVLLFILSLGFTLLPHFCPTYIHTATEMWCLGRFFTFDCGRPSHRRQHTLVTLPPTSHHNGVHTCPCYVKWQHEVRGDPHWGFPFNVARIVPFTNFNAKNALLVALSCLDGQVSLW